MLKRTHLIFYTFLRICSIILGDNLDQESEKFSSSKISASGCCLAFASSFANFSLMLLIKRHVYLDFASEFGIANSVCANILFFPCWANDCVNEVSTATCNFSF